MKSILSFLALIAIVLISSCTHRGRVTMNTIRPADITISSEIETFLLLDRTLLDSKYKLGLIEGILTGELPEEDKAAVQRALSTLNSTFQTSPRFGATIAQERMKGNSVTSAFPDQIPWKTVDELARKNNCQAILAIEVFDTDFIITNATRKVKREVGEGENKKEVEVDEFVAKGVANLSMGIRVYDAINHVIIDEQFYKRTNTWEEAANSKASALAKLIQKSDASSSLAATIANNYAYRVTPLPIRINRMYYTKHKKAPAIESGARMAQVNQWNEAVETWKNGIGIADIKRAGFLCYNAAVGYEVLGDFDNAMKYAQDAYVRYGNNEAQRYVTQLQNRQSDQERLQEQQ